MKIIGLFANCSKPSAPAVLRRLARLASRHGFKLLAAGPTADLLPPACRADPATLLRRMDCLLVLGGDGTMLAAVRLLQGRDIPVLGVNLGSLGFLTSVAERELPRALDCLARGRFTISRRALLACEVLRHGRARSRYQALNDVVVTHGTSSRILTLNLRVDGEEVSAYMADGLIVSTPTGSTGHSLSAGGPILLPAARTLVISPICPHTLSVRPLVIPDVRRVEIAVARSAGQPLLAVDGQVGEALQAGDRVAIRRSPRQARFVRLPGHSHFAVLRQKLHWRGSTLA